MDVKLGFELNQILNFMLLLLCYVNTHDKVVPKITNTCSAACSHSNVVLIQFNIRFWRIILTAKFHSIHVH